MEEAAAREPADTVEDGSGRIRFLLRYLSPQSGAALVLWRVEAYSATPLAILFIATLGRWPAALVMGSLMAAYTAAFLLLLDGQPALDELRSWASRRRLGRTLNSLVERGDAKGAVARALGIVLAVMIMGPFSRAITFHLLPFRKAVAFPLAVGGSIPHSLLWVGLVFGGLWGPVFLPLLRDSWSEILQPLLETFGL